MLIGYEGLNQTSALLINYSHFISGVQYDPIIEYFTPIEFICTQNVLLLVGTAEGTTNERFRRVISSYFQRGRFGLFPPAGFFLTQKVVSISMKWAGNW